jgi:hypothetical protein
MWGLFKKQRTEPVYGDVRLLKFARVGSKPPYFEVQSFTKACAGDGDEWLEWETRYTHDTYVFALEYMERLIKEMNTKTDEPEVMSYFWKGGR